ncbi:MAG TPA: DUF1175 family protein [Pyrinomonadaceae bacterium]|nr:DUF1175 family protein [Pyrinomonadaceae bacterium]
MRLSTPITICLLLAVAASSAACRHNSQAEARVHTESPPPAAATRWSDSDSDGIPDRAELRTFGDRENFRRWFTGIAEMQFYRASDAWSTEQRDCAGLVRFAWREALRPHDRAWLRRMGDVYEPLAPDVRAYSLDTSPLDERLFRTALGSFKESDASDATFSEFADARTLKDFNTEFVSRDRSRALPGDLLFFYQPWVRKFSFHVMLYVGTAREASEGASDWVVYHTGATHTDAGVVKKVRLATLDEHPDRRWRPVASNRNFLGFYRLKILQ